MLSLPAGTFDNIQCRKETGADARDCETNPCVPCLQLADSNCDGAVNAFDIDAFVLALTEPETWLAQYTCDFVCANDINCDGAVNAFDIDAFVACLTGGPCAPCP